MMAEAEKRDHRKIGKEQDWFMIHEWAPGIPFFLPKGMTILMELTKFVREHSSGPGYQEIRTPQLLNAELWKTSGHWEHYKDDMFCLHHAEDDMDFGIKPMNCPAHMLVFKNNLHSIANCPCA
jgi:threonyl-tRNA synthetase